MTAVARRCVASAVTVVSVTPPSMASDMPRVYIVAKRYHLVLGRSASSCRYRESA